MHNGVFPQLKCFGCVKSIVLQSDVIARGLVVETSALKNKGVPMLIYLIAVLSGTYFIASRSILSPRVNS